MSPVVSRRPAPHVPPGRPSGACPAGGLHSAAARTAARREWTVRSGLIATDVVLLAAAFLVAHVLRFPWELRSGRMLGGITEFLVAPVIVVLWLTMLASMRTRDRRITGVGGDEYRRVVSASLVTGGIVAVVAYASDVDVARGYVAIAFPLGLVLLALGRKAWRTAVARARSRGEHLTDVLLVGDVEDVRYVANRIATTPAAGYRVAGALTDCPVSGTITDAHDGVPVLGRVDDVLTVAESAGVSAVVFTGSVPGGHQRLRQLGWELEDRGVELVVSSPLVDVAAARVHHRPVDGLPLMHVETPDYTRRLAKRLLDVVGAALGLLVLAPLLVVVAVAVRLDDGGPVLFSQARVGRGGSEFAIRKFRTMCTDAEARMVTLAQQNDGDGPLFKMKDDPRVTRVGAFLRRTSLDELPQLWNVLVGDMSLVGPRPALPREVALYADFADRRLLVTPGITGLWQVSGRSDLDWADGLRLDLHYVENWSFVHDLVILGRTIPSVLRSRGAY